VKDLWYILASVILNVAGQMCIKKGALLKGPLDIIARGLSATAVAIFTSPFIMAGLFLYVVSAFCWIVALSRVELSYAYPILSLGYILIMFLSHWLFHEHLSALRIMGTVGVIVGLFLIFKS